MNNQLITFLILLVFFSSCKENKYQTEENTLSYVLKDNNYLETKKCVVLIPAMGCGKCTEQIIEFSKKEIKNNSLLFIYSDLTNKTELVFKDIKISKNNYFRDSLSILISRGLVENKPVACFIKDKHIVGLIRFDDSNAKMIIAKIKKL